MSRPTIPLQHDRFQNHWQRVPASSPVAAQDRPADENSGKSGVFSLIGLFGYFLIVGAIGSLIVARFVSEMAKLSLFDWLHCYGV